jgi:hypothetical protein
MENTMENEDIPAIQDKKQDYAWLKPTQWKKGQSGNPKGKKPGKSMKTYLKERFEKMTDKEKIEFLNRVEPNVAWRMAEGNPKTEVEADLNVKAEKIAEVIKATKEILK